VISAFWLAAGIVLYVNVGYPLLIALAALLRQPLAERAPKALPTVTLLLVVHNEEDCIEAKLESLMALDYPKDRLEIEVISDASTDATESIVRRFEDRGVRLLRLPGPRGKAACLNEAVPRARGEILVLTDARQSLAPDAVRRLVGYLGNPEVGAVSGELLLEAPSSRPARGVGLYWRYEKLIRRAESRFDSTVGVTGALYAIRKELFPVLDPRTILDDVVIPMNVVRAGHRVLFAPEAEARDVVHESPAREYRRKVRTLAGNLQLVSLEPWLMSPWRNRLFIQFLSHKLARLLVPWCLPPLLVLSAILAMQGRFVYALILGAQVLLYALALAGGLAARSGRTLPFVSGPYAFVLLNAAAGHAWLSYLRGAQKATWRAIT